MAKLHEILAVESGLQTTAKQTNEETIKTFGKKDEHFIETVRSITHFSEEDQKLNVTEVKAMGIIYLTPSSLPAIIRPESEE